MEKSNDVLYTECYYYLIKAYNIAINHQYKFVYDEFLEHLISDCNVDVDKNYNNKKNKKSGDKRKYQQIVFRSKFYQHFSSKEWYHKIIAPEKCPEIIRRLRINKLKKIKENYGN